MTQLVTIADPRSPEAEAYRSLRTNLAFSGPDGLPSTLLVTSPGPDEGKSAVLANLAVVLARSERRVIVADCDLRRPSQHLLFDVPNGSGISSVLSGEEAGDGDLPLQDTAVDGLSVLTSGELPANPAELLGGTRMPGLIEQLTAQSDIVLFDVPPIVAVTDAAVMAPQTDGVVLVLASGKSRRDHTARARELIDKVGGTLIGVVLTGVEAEAAPYGDYSAEGAS